MTNLTIIEQTLIEISDIRRLATIGLDLAYDDISDAAKYQVLLQVMRDKLVILEDKLDVPFRTEDLITCETITPSFCSRLDALTRRIVVLRNDLRAFKLEQKSKLEFGCY